MAIEILPPQHVWADEFQALKLRILLLAPPRAVIHHIGSTAVSGLAAKDIIDVQLTVDSLEGVDVEAFRNSGFRQSSASIDHQPLGMSIADVELRKILFRSTQGRSLNIHVRERGRFNQRYPLLCRDFLRSHPVAAGAYGLIKQRLAERFPDDEDFYYDIKDPVFDLIVEGANEWARVVAWKEPDGD
jgi:GrpB-like predicted nucleotidyltransferase (UPF0157 family)